MLSFQLGTVGGSRGLELELGLKLRLEVELLELRLELRATVWFNRALELGLEQGLDRARRASAI